MCGIAVVDLQPDWQSTVLVIPPSRGRAATKGIGKMAMIIKGLVSAAALVVVLATPSLALNASPQLAGVSQAQSDETAQVLMIRSHRGRHAYRVYRGGGYYGRGFDYQYQRN
jgi:hypothetical protein